MSQKDFTSPKSDVLDASPGVDNRVSHLLLAASENPALARMSSLIRAQSSDGQPSNYSRMHNRHNRS